MEKVRGSIPSRSTVRSSSLKERAGVKGFLACGFACVHRLQGMRNDLVAAFPDRCLVSCERAGGSGTGRQPGRVSGAAGVLDALPASR